MDRQHEFSNQRNLMSSKLDGLLSAIVTTQDSGLTIGAMKAKFLGKSKVKLKERGTELEERLASLIRDGAVRGPLRYGSSQYYFATGYGPSIETASNAVGRLVLRSGVKLLSKSALEGKVTGKDRPFFTDGIKHAVASGVVAELTCGKSKYYIHRDVAAEYFGFEGVASQASAGLSFDEMLLAYRHLKSEQGFSAVKIFDLVNKLRQPKEVVHRLLLEEAKQGRITIHHTTSVELPPEVIDAGIKLPGFPEPFVTVVVKDDR
jgi:hypothetical protein